MNVTEIFKVEFLSNKVVFNGVAIATISNPEYMLWVVSHMTPSDYAKYLTRHDGLTLTTTTVGRLWANVYNEKELIRELRADDHRHSRATKLLEICAGGGINDEMASLGAYDASAQPWWSVRPHAPLEGDDGLSGNQHAPIPGVARKTIPSVYNHIINSIKNLKLIKVDSDLSFNRTGPTLDLDGDTMDHKRFKVRGVLGAFVEMPDAHNEELDLLKEIRNCIREFKG